MWNKHVIGELEDGLEIKEKSLIKVFGV